MSTGGTAGGIFAGGAYVLLTVRDQATAALNRLGARIRMLRAELAGTGFQMQFSGLAMALPLARSLNFFASFDDELRAIKGFAGATDEQLQSLGKTFREIALNAPFNATQLAESGRVLAQAGFSAPEIQGAIDTMQAFARAARMDLPMVTEHAARMARGWGISMQEVADIASRALSESPQMLDDFAEGMKFTTLEARDSGLTFQETAAAITLFSERAIKGSLAGTALRRVLATLRTAEGRRQIESLGVAVDDGTGKMRNAITILGELFEAANTSELRRLQIFGELFQIRGAGVAGLLGAPGASDRLEELIDQFSEAQGFVQELAATMDEGVGGAIRRIVSAFQNFVMSIGEAMEKIVLPMEETIRGITSSLQTFTESPAGQKFVQTLAKISLALIGVGSVMILLAGVGTVLRFIIGGVQFLAVLLMGPFVNGFRLGALAVKTLGPLIMKMIANPIGLAVLAAVAFGAAWFVVSGQLQKTGRIFSEMAGGMLNDIGLIGEALKSAFTLRSVNASESFANELRIMELGFDLLWKRMEAGFMKAWRSMWANASADFVRNLSYTSGAGLLARLLLGSEGMGILDDTIRGRPDTLGNQDQEEINSIREEIQMLIDTMNEEIAAERARKEQEELGQRIQDEWIAEQRRQAGGEAIQNAIEDAFSSAGVLGSLAAPLLNQMQGSRKVEEEQLEVMEETRDIAGLTLEEIINIQFVSTFI